MIFKTFLALVLILTLTQVDSAPNPTQSSRTPYPSSSAFYLQNGLDAQEWNAKFGSLKTSDSCTAGDWACVQGRLAECVGGSWVLTACSSGMSCFVLPLALSPGTRLACDTRSSALNQIQGTGAQGGITGNDTLESVPFSVASSWHRRYNLLRVNRRHGNEHRMDSGYTSGTDRSSPGPTTPPSILTSFNPTSPSSTPSTSTSSFSSTFTPPPSPPSSTPSNPRLAQRFTECFHIRDQILTLTSYTTDTTTVTLPTTVTTTIVSTLVSTSFVTSTLQSTTTTTVVSSGLPTTKTISLPATYTTGIPVTVTSEFLLTLTTTTTEVFTVTSTSILPGPSTT